MKRIKTFFLISAATFLALSAWGQGIFQNLDFEAAAISQNQATGSVSVTDALPGWGVYFYYGPAGQTSIPQSQISFSFVNPWVPQVVLLGTNGGGQSSLNGAFSVLLQAMNLPGYQLN